MNRLILIALALLLALSVTGGAQIQSNSECVAAKTWHLQQAMKVTLAGDQAYHLGAAQAADELGSLAGSPCSGWKDWATGRSAAVEP